MIPVGCALGKKCPSAKEPRREGILGALLSMMPFCPPVAFRRNKEAPFLVNIWFRELALGAGNTASEKQTSEDRFPPKSRRFEGVVGLPLVTHNSHQTLRLFPHAFSDTPEVSPQDASDLFFVKTDRDKVLGNLWQALNVGNRPSRHNQHPPASRWGSTRTTPKPLHSVQRPLLRPAPGRNPG